MSVSSLTSIFRTGLSALRVSQEGLNVASQNIANVNTPGYVRVEIEQSARSQLGVGGGVEVSNVRRAADRFLAAAGYTAEAARGGSQARYDLLSRAQSYFGDPSGEATVFAALDRIWSSFTNVGLDPSSTLRRNETIQSISSAFSEISRLATDVQGLIAEADERIAAKVTEAQDLITRIHALNGEIQYSRRVAADTSGAENAQAALVDKLSALIDVRVTPQESGGVHVRTATGGLLVGQDYATLSYTPSGATFASFSPISYAFSADQPTNFEPYLAGGELQGLLQARDVDLRGLADALGGLAGELGDALNATHNRNTASPAPGELVGRQTGLLSGDALNFTGVATIGIVDSGGALTRRLTVNFDTAPPRIDVQTALGASTNTFSNSIGSFASALNLALGADGSADFTDGRLSIRANGGAGISIAQDDVGAGGAARAGRGLSHFFGLNDIVSRPDPLFFETGGSPSDAHGLAAGGSLTFDVRDANGRVVAQPTFTISGALAAGGSTWANLVTALNDTTTGLGRYATFSYTTDGRITSTPVGGFTTELTNDTTARGATGVQASGLFGIGVAARATRAVQAEIADPVADDPMRLALGRPDLSASFGARIIETGDNLGATALARTRDQTRTFAAAGMMARQTTTLASFASRLAGEAGRLATDADRDVSGAQAIAKAAADRRADMEGVTLDDELIRMTVYQNAYAAASRIIQAADDMFQILLNLGR